MSILSEEGEKVVRELFIQIAKDQKLSIEKDDVKRIVYELIPHLDDMIAKQVKLHLKEIASIVINKI